MTNPNEPPVNRPQDFAELLIKNDKGRTILAASENLRTVVAAVLETGKSGTVTVTFKIAADDVDDRRLVVTALVGSKPPLPDPKSAIWYADGTLALTREDPKQDPLFFGVPSPRMTADQYRNPED